MNWTEYYNKMQTLYDRIKVIMYIDPDSRNLSHDEFISKLRIIGCRNSAESISRARRKVWQNHPDLKPKDKKYKQEKAQQEIAIRSWATLD